MNNKPILIIAGPTASGKTDLAINIAQNGNFEIINADAMQIYSDIPIISAQPTMDERNSIPHWLLGHMQGDVIYSAAWWLEEAVRAIHDIRARNKVPMIVGGTGMYIKALIDGLSKIPTIEPEIRNLARDLYNIEGQEKFYKLLNAKDPKTIDRIKPTDTQRMIRAYEVFKQTNSSIFDWQEMPIEKQFAPESFLFIQTDINRKILHQRINNRFITMVESGALDEVEYIIKNYNSPILSITKAHGVPELSQYILGNISLATAIDKGQTITRQYAKRQITWFRHQVKNIQQINCNDPGDLSLIIPHVDKFLSTLHSEHR